jgi:serine/threonine-protein kinase ATR
LHFLVNLIFYRLFICSFSIFDKGLNLPRPEVVPFRLTPNMVDAMGPTGWEGTYRGGLISAMKTIRDNRDILLSVLEPFVKDPVIDWQRRESSRSRRSGNNSKGDDAGTVQAKRSIKVIDARLKGVFHVRNPNMTKIKRTDGYAVDAEDEMTNILPLSVEGQVHRMIGEATSTENHVQLFVGWMPWI